jgi:hypothetical protein
MLGPAQKATEDTNSDVSPKRLSFMRPARCHGVDHYELATSPSMVTTSPCGTAGDHKNP